MFDLPNWLKENRVPVSDTRQDTTKTEYILAACPWNSAHGTSAVVWQDKSGKINAGCSHLECKGKGWADLNRLYPSKQEGLSPADMLTNYLENTYSLVKTQHSEPYIISEHPIKVRSPEFEQLIRLAYRQMTGKTLTRMQVATVVETIAAIAVTEGTTYTSGLRILKYKGTVFYDLIANEQVVCINATGVYIISALDMPIIFERTADMLPQVTPHLDNLVLSDFIPTLAKLFRVEPSQQLLFAVWLTACYCPNIAHPVLLIHGEKGSAKSSALSLLGKLISPTNDSLCILPNIQDLPTVLANNYAVFFDNVGYINTEVANMLCVGVTGGSIKKRKLYTDGEMVSLSLQRILAINGVDILSYVPSDLADRCVMINFTRIAHHERISLDTIERLFDELAPHILGMCFKILSAAIKTYKTISLEKLPRMADFAKLGYCIAEAIGQGLGEQFLNDYETNQIEAVLENTSNNQFVWVLGSFLEGRNQWIGSVSQLYCELKNHAEINLRININICKEFPKAPNYLSRRLSQYKSDLNKLKIEFSISNIGEYKEITLIKITA